MSPSPTHPPLPVVPLPFTGQVLEDIALTIQTQLVSPAVPFCAFNGGNDVFVDVGNKSLGLDALMRYTKVLPAEVSRWTPLAWLLAASENPELLRGC